MSKDEQVRLNKYISDSGFCSRREADRYIEEGRVTINENMPKMGAMVRPGDVVAVDGETIKSKKPTDRPIVLAFNKPAGVTSTTDPKDKTNIIDFIGYPKRIFPIGRLDNPTEGLIFLTNDGDLVNKILRADNNHDKEYFVTVDKPVTDEFIAKMSNGVRLFEGVTKKCFVQKRGIKSFTIVLTQGWNRQVRRMCEALEYKATSLKRTRIMNVKLADLPTGHWRHLTPDEMKGLLEAVADSSKTEEASAKTRTSAKQAAEEAENDFSDLREEEEFGVKVHYAKPQQSLPASEHKRTLPGEVKREYFERKAKYPAKKTGSGTVAGKPKAEATGKPKPASTRGPKSAAPTKTGSRPLANSGNPKSAANRKSKASGPAKRTAGTRGGKRSK
ncbi:23S rRNA pseudouridine(2604) synthase RluF [Nibribacter ruber]|uniref:Pseudouridine synthase n=1 Tax=Nibribacter ruber TaxID=2698458 RepID=A0A6P1NVB9_9BACT|nr:23S rRNA pseudouridine(2604) synthase RluF [Nibribacter ruber]QHL85918.1 23S rRNA pseudouridine(2604) synthase RluF [Nibribacter ruber]